MAHVRLQILPFAHAATGPGFTLLTTNTPDLAPTWFCETNATSITCTDNRDLTSRHQNAFGELARQALSPQDSLARLKDIHQCHRNGSRRLTLSPEACRRLHEELGISIRKLADVFDCDFDTIDRRLGKYSPDDPMPEPIIADYPLTPRRCRT